MHFNEALRLEEIDTIPDTELPYRWIYKIADPIRPDTMLTAAGSYAHKIPAEGGCMNEEYLQLVVFPTYLYELDTTICEADLPFLWRGKSLQHAIGTTKQYEDRFLTVNNTDSIYRLILTIDPAPKHTERISVCENKDTLINGKSYFDKTLYPVGMVFRDTMNKPNAGGECDSIIYYEITKVPQRRIMEERIMHVGETFEWHGITIDEPKTAIYTIEDEVDPVTGCEIIYQLSVIAETPYSVSICVMDTPYTWMVNGKDYYTTGLYTDTVRTDRNFITEFRTLDLTVQIPVDTVVVYAKAFLHDDEAGISGMRNEDLFKSELMHLPNSNWESRGNFCEPRDEYIKKYIATL